MVSSDGAERLEAIGRRLKAEGRGDLRKQLLKTLRDAGKPLVSDVKTSARTVLPQRGGLADLVGGSSFGVRSRLSGSNAGIRIEGTSRSVKSLRSLNEGRLRHPVFGDKSRWAEQEIDPGFFETPIVKRQDEFKRGIEAALKDVAAQVEKGM